LKSIFFFALHKIIILNKTRAREHYKNRFKIRGANSCLLVRWERLLSRHTGND
jgi:hypothetical protein